MHEVLIHEDEARTTIDLGDRYVVEPAIHLYEFVSLTESGHARVPAGFCYRSDSNKVWMDAGAMRTMLKQEGYLPRSGGAAR